MSLSSMTTRDIMTPVESPGNSGDLQNMTKKSPAKPDILEVNPMACRQHLLNTMFSLHETGSHMSSSQAERKMSTTKPDSLDLTPPKNVSRDLLNAMFNQRQTTDDISSSHEGKTNLATKSNSLVINPTGVGHELYNTTHFLHDSANSVLSPVKRKSESNLSEVKHNMSNQLYPSNDNSVDLEDNQSKGYLHFESTDDVSLYLGDDCETESASRESHHDKYCLGVSGNTNEPNTHETDKYDPERISVASESERDYIKGGFFDGKRKIIRSDDITKSQVIVGKFKGTSENKEMCDEEANHSHVVMPGQFRKPSKDSLNSEEASVGSTLAVPRDTNPATAHKIRAHSAPSGVENDRKATSQIVKCLPATKEGINKLGLDIKADKYSNQEQDKGNNIISSSPSTSLSGDSEKSYVKIPKDFTGPNPECKLLQFITHDFKNTDNRYLNTEIAITRKDSQSRVNTNRDNRHAVGLTNKHATIQTPRVLLQQTTVIDTTTDSEENGEPGAGKSQSLYLDMRQVEDTSRGVDVTKNTAAQNSRKGGISINQRHVGLYQTYHNGINTANTELEKHNCSSIKAQYNKNRPVRNQINNMLPESREDELKQADGLANQQGEKQLKDLIGYTARRKLGLLGNWKKSSSSRKNSWSDPNMKEVQKGRKKQEAVYATMESLQHSIHNMPKVKQNSVSSGKYVSAGKAIDRLLIGPYTKKRQIPFSPVGFQYGNITKTNRMKAFGKRKYRHITLTTDAKSNQGYSDNRADNSTRNIMTTSRHSSFISEDDWFILNEHAKSKTVKAIKSDTIKKTFSIWTQMNAAKKPHSETSDREGISSSTEGKDQSDAQILTDATKDVQAETLAPRSQDNTICPPMGNGLSRNVSGVNAVGPEITLQENVVATLKNNSTDNQGDCFPGGGDKEKTELLFAETALDEREEKDDPVQAMHITEVQNTPAQSNTLLDVNDKFILTSPEYNEREKMVVQAVDPSQRVSKDGDISTSPSGSHVAARTALNKPKEQTNPADSPRATSATVTFVEETITTKATKNVATKLKTLNDEHHSFTIQNLPVSINPSAVFRNMPAAIMKNERVDSKVLGDGVLKPVLKNQEIAQGVHNHTPKDDSQLDENIVWQNVSRSSPHPSLDTISRKSVDFSIQKATLATQHVAGGGHKHAAAREESFIHKAIPLLPVPLAVLCLVLNILLPGSGTAFSGFLTVCCGQPRVPKKDDQILTSMCVNCLVGLAQLCTVTFLLIGWLWSIVWGAQIVRLSVQRRKELKEQKAAKLQTLALSAFETAGK